MSPTDLYIQNLLESNPLREPLLCEIIETLGLPAGSRGLDAGCGIGLQTMLLLDAVGLNGHVTGLDILPELLTNAGEVVEQAGLTEFITFRQGDVHRLPFDDNTFDWAWSMDCVGYPAGEIGPALNELKRVVRPGGDVILLGWSSQQVLPGYPLLEARLNGSCSGYLPFLRDRMPESNFMRALPVLQQSGLEDVMAHTFAGDIQGPLADDQRNALICLFEMLWGTPQPGESQNDRLEFERLCKPASPDFILDIPDYYAFFTYTMFRGRVKE